MLEIPEAYTIARQINDSLKGKRIAKVVAAGSPHKFAWYYGDPQEYSQRLTGKVIDQAKSYGGLVEVTAGNVQLLFGDGVRLQYHDVNDKVPLKHQLLIQFGDSSSLSAVVQMYGGLWCFPEGELDNPYYTAARQKVSPLSDAFDYSCFAQLITAPEVQKLSAKALLATEQRIPGLGNGVLQDILYNARIHPKQKTAALSDSRRRDLFGAIKSTLAEMTSQGGRDTEKNLYGQPGGYITRLSKNTVGQSCSRCGGTIRKESYLGGSIYYCDGCQILNP